MSTGRPDPDPWADVSPDVDDLTQQADAAQASRPDPGTDDWRYATGNYVDPEPEWDSQDSNAYHDRQELAEAATVPDWQKVYGDGWEERIWDGRGLSANDVKPEHIREGTEATAKADAEDAGLTGYGPFICKTEQEPEHDREAGG